jgi:hypothetical protein
MIGITADKSGNGHHFTKTGLVATDKTLDSPTNNFSVMNNVSDVGGTALSEGNLVCTNAADSWPSVFSTMGMTSGKWYFEAYGTDVTRFAVGIAPKEFTTTDFDVESGAYVAYSTDPLTLYNNASSASAINGTPAFVAGNILGFAIDIDAGKMWISINNTYVNDSGGDAGTPAAGNDPVMTFTAGTEMFVQATINRANIRFNFGQDSSFAGGKTAQGNQDGNSIGDFYYTPPAGFLALCTSNLSEPTIVDPTEHFNAVLYTGNGQDNRAVTGVGFQPDWVFIKGRSAGESTLHDVLRGPGNGLFAESDSAEDTGGNLVSFDSDGFTTSDSNRANANNRTIVAYNWKAGGSGVSASNLTGVGTATISANTKAGFSIVQWTSTQGGPVSYGHGLSQAPEFVITKSVTDTDYWSVGHENLGWEKGWNLNDRRTAVDTTAYWNDTSPTSTIVTLGGGVNNAKRFICYNFHSVDGYQKFGKYAGTQDDDGPFVYLGFRPAFLMIFHITTQDDGHLILDSAREPLNRVDLLLYASNTDAEADNSGTTTTTSRGIDFLSNGFKLRGANSLVNYSSRDYAYWAIAEAPFKYANAR